MRDIMEIMPDQPPLARGGGLCGAAPFEWAEARADYRNGVRERVFTTRIGKVTLEVPRLRPQSVADGPIGRHGRPGQAIIAAVAEMVVKGVPARDAGDVARAPSGEGAPKGQASGMCAVPGPVVAEFRGRPLDYYYPFVVAGATCLRVREGDRVAPEAPCVALGADVRGRREVLGLMPPGREGKAGRKGLLASLMARGLERAGLVVSGGHAGLRDAIAEEPLGASRRRRLAHLARNVPGKAPKSMWAEAKASLRDIYDAPDIGKARGRMGEAVSALAGRAPKAAMLLEEGFDDITAVFSLPQKRCVKLRTPDAIERADGEIRRRDRALRIYPGEGSVMRVIGTLLTGMHEGWKEGRPCLEMSERLGQAAIRDGEGGGVASMPAAGVCCVA